MVERLLGLHRRTVLLQLLGLASAGLAGSARAQPASQAQTSHHSRRGTAAPSARLPFQPLRGPIPLPSDGLSAAGQQRAYSRVALQDQLLLPKGYGSEVLVQWGDPVSSGRCGFNNDYLAFTPRPGVVAIRRLDGGSLLRS